MSESIVLFQKSVFRRREALPGLSFVYESRTDALSPGFTKKKTRFEVKEGRDEKRAVRERARYLVQLTFVLSTERQSPRFLQNASLCSSELRKLDSHLEEERKDVEFDRGEGRMTTRRTLPFTPLVKLEVY